MGRGTARIMFIFGTGRLVGARLAIAAMLALAPLNAQAGNFDNGLMRLAEILGAVHHLRNICGTNDGPLWRNKMIDMMNAVELAAPDRQKIITHFNDAYYQARTDYPVCTDEAAQRADLLFSEGHQLAGELANEGKEMPSPF